MVKYRRKIVLINRRFQINLILKFVIVNIGIMALFGFLIYLFLDSEIEANLLSSHTKYKNMKDMLLPIVLALSFINVLISSFIIAFFVLFASFRIAGPLFRFNSALNEITSGNLKPYINLREKDQLFEISQSLQSFSEQFCNDFTQLDEIRKQLIEINTQLNNKPTQECIQKLSQVIEQYQF